MVTRYINCGEKAETFPADIKKLLNSISVPVFDRYEDSAFYEILPPLADLYPNDPAAAAKHLFAHFYKVMEMWGYHDPTGEIFLYAPDGDSQSWEIRWEAGPDDWAIGICISSDEWYIDAVTSDSVAFALS